LAGLVTAAGLTQPQLEASVVEALKKCCLNDPHPTVVVEAVHSKKIYFDGDGIRTGPMDYVLPINLLEAISSNGGFKDFANKRRIRILRDGKQFTTINYNDIISGKHPEKNILLLPGDHVIVN
jgi:protein involved in polysaccharide export with SLBB domain